MFFNRSGRVTQASGLIFFGPPTVILIRRIYDAAFEMASKGHHWGMTIDSFQLLAWGVAFYLLVQLRQTRDLRRIDVAAAIVICVVGALNAAIGLAALTFFLFVATGGDVRWRAVATVFGALFAQQAIVPILYDLIVPILMQFDAMLVGSAVKLTIAGAEWQHNIITVPSGHAVEVLPGCCSFNNVSLAALSWVALTKLERPEWRPLDLVVLGSSAGCQILFNTARIYLMALSLEQFLYWHDGTGKEIFTACASVAAVLISAFGARLVTPRRSSGPLAVSSV